MSFGHLLSSHVVRRKNRVDRCAGTVVAIRPKMGIGVERLTRRRMARPGLNSLDRLTVADFAATRKSAATRETRCQRVPAALTAARHTCPNAERPIGRPASVTNTNPSAGAGNAARCAASTSTTTCGNGTVRTDARVVGGERNGGRPLTVTSCLSTRTVRVGGAFGKSTSRLVIVPIGSDRAVDDRPLGGSFVHAANRYPVACKANREIWRSKWRIV